MSAKKTQKQILETGSAVLMPNYGERDVVMVRGEGCRLFDAEGREYLDFLSGIAVNNVGHCHPKVVEAIREQAGKLIHASNVYVLEPQVELAQRLTRASGMDRAFFANSGTEATEGGIKLARKWATTTKGPGHEKVMSFSGSFHGRTYAAMSATWSQKVREGFGPLVPNHVFATFNDLASVDQAWSDEVCAVIVETVQGEGGINVAEAEFLHGLRERCTERGALLICDEIQCGMGRTGRAFAFQHAGVEPDVVLVAKAVGGGLPLGAILATKDVADVLQPGSHGSTFGGNPVACAAANAVCEIVFDEAFLEEVGKKGCKWWGMLEGLKGEFPDLIEGIRGLGLMQGLVLKRPGRPAMGMAQEEGLLIHCTAERVLRFLPPLTVTDNDMEQACTRLRAALEQFSKTGEPASAAR